MFSSHTPKVFKINIFINLTDTNEKLSKLEIMELILPEEKVSKEKLEFNVRNYGFTDSSHIESVQNMLEYMVRLNNLIFPPHLGSTN